MRKFLIVFAVIFAVASCTTIPPAKTVFEPAQTYQTSFDDVWEAVVESFAETNTPIKNIDKNSGLIVAEMMAVPHVDGGPGEGITSDFCDCGTPPGLMRQTGLVGNFNVFVRTLKDGQVQVRVNSRFVTRILAAPALPAIECESKGFFEERFLRRLADRL